MFLNLLNEKEKEIFMQLAVAVIHADGKLEESEKIFLDDYAHEMNISDFDVYKKPESVEHLVGEITTNSSNTVKRIFLLELAALARTDGDFAQSERELIQLIAEKLNISDGLLQDCENLLKEYESISERLLAFVQG
ncbi:MAG: hypothetical protein J6K76_07525 [Spirochaetaceae bacterium]|nr:hypothetical protein [Spirochaetaceae bacterium]